MNSGREISSLVAQRQDLDQFRRKNWEGTFEEYLDIVRSEPRVTGEYFSLGWATKNGIAWCPMNEEPLHLIPERFRKEVQDKLNASAPPGDYRVTSTGELCPFCRYVYSEVLKQYDGNWTRVVQDVRVKRLLLSEKDCIGIGTFQPKDEKNQDSTELTGDINYRKIGEYGSDSDHHRDKREIVMTDNSKKPNESHSCGSPDHATQLFCKVRREGDEAALAEFMATAGQTLTEWTVRWCKQTGLSPELGEVFANEAMLKGLAAETFDCKRKVLPWLSSIAKNKGRDYLRVEKRLERLMREVHRRCVTERDDTIAPTLARQIKLTPLNELVEREEKQERDREIAALLEAIKFLPEIERKVVESRLAGERNRDIAKTLDAGGKPIEVVFFRAKKRLRRLVLILLGNDSVRGRGA